MNGNIIIMSNPVRTVAEDSTSDAVQVHNCVLSTHVSQVVEYLLQLLSKRILVEKSQTNHLLYVKIGRQNIDNVKNQIWCTVKVGSKNLNHLQIHMEEYLQSCHPEFPAFIKEMQDQFGGEHLWCEYPMNNGHETSTCRRDQWTIGAPAGPPTCSTVERQKQINTCSFCFRILQDTYHVVEESKHIENFLHKIAIIHPQVTLKLCLEIEKKTRVCDFSPHFPRCSIGQKKILCDIRHYTRFRKNSPTGSCKIYLRCGVSYNLQHINFGSTLERVQLKVHAVAALIPPRPITTSLLNHTIKKLQVVFYGPGDIPLSSTNRAQLGLCPTTLFKLEDYGLKIGERITQEDFVGGQGFVHCDWCFRVDVLDIASMEEDPESDDNSDDTTLLVILFINALDKNKYTSLDNIQLVHHLHNSCAQVICKNKAKMRKAVGTALNKILHNFSAHDQRQKLLDTSIPLITSAMSSIVTHSTNVNFRSDIFRQFEVSETRDYRKKLKSDLWNIANEAYRVVVPGAACSTEVKKAHRNAPLSDSAGNLECNPACTNDLENLAVRDADANRNTPEIRGHLPASRSTDFEDLGLEATVSNREVVEKKTEQLCSANGGLVMPPNTSLHMNDRTISVRSGHPVRRSLSMEFDSHAQVHLSAAHLNGSPVQQNVLLDPFELLGDDQALLSDAATLLCKSNGNTSLEKPKQDQTQVVLDMEGSITQGLKEDWWDSVTWT